MATINLTFGVVDRIGEALVQVLAIRATENITPSGASQASTNSGASTPSGRYTVVRINGNADVWFATGQAPVATTASSLYLANQIIEAPLAPGEKIAILAATP